MRLASILSEALRNIASGTSHAFMMMLAVLIGGTLLGGYETVNIAGLENQAAARVSAYADARAVVGGKVDGSACDRLSYGMGDSAASGAMRQATAVIPASTPGRELTTYEVTAGMLRMVSSGTPSSRMDVSGAWVSKDVSHDFGLVTGSRLQTTRGMLTIAGVFDWPNDGRDTRFAYAMLIPAPASSGTFDECWARSWPESEQIDSLLLSTVASSSDGQRAGVTGVNKGFDMHYDAQASYHARMTRWTPLVALGLGLLLGLVATRRRRLEYAGALHSGQGKGAQLLEIGVETLVWAGLGTLASCSLVVACCLRLTHDPGTVTLASLRPPLMLFAGALLAALAAALPIRQSQLFRYFKNR
ncbi:hypothetical protein [Bifidobacterium leontopitheci]|uniref:Uncharacterized protein n=1 Tax=Bifidobacterium leontopitheci TaxID=2650774 RepID=A0A6I1GTG9_9BIFI|nr:hypothetical protein [Bifidobacterium leontopitheci]KAB7791488.1 hypothetical protein F7D09_0163 [Bifidobacterium leontopitheci]